MVLQEEFQRLVAVHVRWNGDFEILLGLLQVPELVVNESSWVCQQCFNLDPRSLLWLDRIWLFQSRRRRFCRQNLQTGVPLLLANLLTIVADKQAAYTAMNIKRSLQSVMRESLRGRLQQDVCKSDCSLLALFFSAAHRHESIRQSWNSTVLMSAHHWGHLGGRRGVSRMLKSDSKEQVFCTRDRDDLVGPEESCLEGFFGNRATNNITKTT